MTTALAVVTDQVQRGHEARLDCDRRINHREIEWDAAVAHFTCAPSERRQALALVALSIGNHE